MKTKPTTKALLRKLTSEQRKKLFKKAFLRVIKSNPGLDKGLAQLIVEGEKILRDWDLPRHKTNTKTTKP